MDDWLPNISLKFNSKFLVNILKTNLSKKQLQIAGVTVLELRRPSLNISDITRIRVKCRIFDHCFDNPELVTYYMFVKSIPKEAARRKTFRSDGFFLNESIFYNEVWPALNLFQLSKGVDEFKNVPLCFYADHFIVLEDLSHKGFKQLHRRTEMDLPHTLVILRQIAKFHALSFAYKDQQPKTFRKISNRLQERFYSEELRSWNEKARNNPLKVIKDAVKKQFPSSYSTRFDDLINSDLYGKVAKLCCEEQKFSVVTHGDFWTSNILIKYDENSDLPKEVVFVDFQLSRYSSFVQDVLLFLYACVSQSTRDLHWNLILDDYFTTLVNYIEKLGSSKELITEKDLKAELKNNGIYALSMVSSPLVLSVIEDHEFGTCPSLEGEDEVPLESVWNLSVPLNSKHKREKLASVVKDLVDRDYI